MADNSSANNDGENPDHGLPLQRTNPDVENPVDGPPPYRINSDVENPVDGSPPYRVGPLEGKGIAAFATRKIAVGEIIVEEKPVLTLAFRQEIHQGILDNLPLETRTAIMALQDSVMPNGEKTLLTILNTNMFACDDMSGNRILCLQISRFNHSCIPNCTTKFSPGRQTHSVYASCDIDVGEELCVEYVPIIQSAQERSWALHHKYGFTCACEVCSLPEEERKMSDRRRERLNKLLDTRRSVGRKDPRAGLTLIKEYLDLLEEEKLAFPVFIAPLSCDAFQLALAAQDLALAKRWIKKAYLQYVQCEGVGGEHALQMARYVQNPTSHWCWGR